MRTSPTGLATFLRPSWMSECVQPNAATHAQRQRPPHAVWHVSDCMFCACWARSAVARSMQAGHHRNYMESKHSHGRHRKHSPWRNGMPECRLSLSTLRVRCRGHHGHRPGAVAHAAQVRRPAAMGGAHWCAPSARPTRCWKRRRCARPCLRRPCSEGSGY